MVWHRLYIDVVAIELIILILINKLIDFFVFIGADSSKIQRFVFFERERGKEAKERDGGQRGGTKAKAGSSKSRRGNGPAAEVRGNSRGQWAMGKGQWAAAEGQR